MLSYKQYLKERYVKDIIQEENLDEGIFKDAMDVKGQEGSLKGLAYDFVPGLSLARAVKRYKSGMTSGGDATLDIGLGALESIPGLGTAVGKGLKGVYKGAKFLMGAKKASTAANAASKIAKKPSITKKVVSAPFKAIDRAAPYAAAPAAGVASVDALKRSDEWKRQKQGKE